MDFLFIMLALICLAVLETIQHHFFDSIFFNITSNFWFCFWQSDWRNKYVNGEPERGKLTGWDYIKSIFDGYHVSKWLMIIFFILAGYFQMIKTNVMWFGQISFYALLIYWTHRLFYGYLLLAKENRKPLLS